MKELQLKNSNFDVIGLLKKIEKFKHFSDQEIHDCVNVGIFREYEPGETIIKDGDLDRWVYMLLKGILSIEKGDQSLGALQRCGDVFGEMGVIDGSPRSATIRAQSKTVLLCLEASIIEKSLAKGKSNFCYLIFRIFAEVLAVRLRNTTDEVVKLKKENIELKKKLTKVPAPTIKPHGKMKVSIENKKILIVDNNESTRKILRSIVRDLKFKDVIEAENVSDAMQRIHTESIDIIVSDSNLPKFSVIDLLQKVRDDNTYDKVPFIILLNGSELNKVKSTITSDRYNTIIKPFNANTIHDGIRSAMNTINKERD